MKPITFITTMVACDDTFDKIQLLNRDFTPDHFKTNLVVLRGSFSPDVFEWVDNPNNPSWWRYWHNQATSATEIAEDRYNHYLNCMPPIYFTHIDGEKVKGGFCVSEAYTHTLNDVPVFTACYEFNHRYYEKLVILLKNTDNFIREYNSQEYSIDNYAISYIK